MALSIFNKVSPAFIAELQKICGNENVFSSADAVENYSHDETEDLKYFPEAVVKPRTAEEISAVLKICNRENIPATPRGAGTGLTGTEMSVYHPLPDPRGNPCACAAA